MSCIFVALTAPITIRTRYRSCQSITCCRRQNTHRESGQVSYCRLFRLRVREPPPYIHKAITMEMKIMKLMPTPNTGSCLVPCSLARICRCRHWKPGIPSMGWLWRSPKNWSYRGRVCVRMDIVKLIYFFFLLFSWKVSESNFLLISMSNIQVTAIAPPGQSRTARALLLIMTGIFECPYTIYLDEIGA